jgi:hypothetical protein
VRLDISTVLLQWSTGGLLGCWVTTRRREVGLGYGWLLRATFIVAAVGAVVAGRASGDHGTGAAIRDVGAAGVAAAAASALVVSVLRRESGVRGQRARQAARRQRVARMLARNGVEGAEPSRKPRGSAEHGALAATLPREFPPALDLVAPALGAVGLLGAVSAAGGPYALGLARTLAGSLFLGAVTDAMLLGHWYLVQPGLARDPIKELVRLVVWLWPLEVAALLWPTGMLQVLSGTVDDGWNGLLGWTWAVSAASTIVLVGVTWLALKERSYSAVMAATGLLYLAILTAFGTDLVARAVLA